MYVLEVGLEEHHHLHPVRVYTTPVLNEEVTAGSEIALNRLCINQRALLQSFCIDENKSKTFLNHPPSTTAIREKKKSTCTASSTSHYYLTIE